MGIGVAPCNCRVQLSSFPRIGTVSPRALMKILYSHRTKSADGQYVHIRALTDALRARGHTLSIAGPEGVSDMAVRDLDAAAPDRSRIWMPKAIYEGAEFAYSVPAWRRLERTASTFDPDILYERFNLYFHAGLWLKRKRSLPLILEVNAPLKEERSRHGGLALKPLAGYSERTLWRGADAVLPVTRVLAEKIIAEGADAARVHVIPNGVDETFLTATNGESVRDRLNLSGKTVLGFTGFVRSWHGVDRVLRFMAHADDPSLHLLLVGDGPARAHLEALAKDLGLRDRLSVTGIVQRKDVAMHVAAFDIALQPAVVPYASPLKLFEYMAMGKAIIAPDEPNIREVLEPNVDGLLFNPHKEGEIEQALGALTRDGELRARLGLAALATLKRGDYTWDGNARRVEQIAQTLLTNRTEVPVP